MCTDFITDVIWMNTMCTVSLANYVRAVASATEQRKGEPHKSEVLLIASTLIVVKAENISRNTIKMHKMQTAVLRWFASDTAHIVFIHITVVVKSVLILMARKRIFKSCIMGWAVSIAFCISISYIYMDNDVYIVHILIYTYTQLTHK